MVKVNEKLEKLAYQFKLCENTVRLKVGDITVGISSIKHANSIVSPDCVYFWSWLKNNAVPIAFQQILAEGID